VEKEEFFSFLGKSIGTKVDIINKSGINKGIYSSNVLDLKDGMIGLSQPMYKGSWVQMSSMELAINVKTDSNLIEALVISHGTTFDGQIPILWVEPIGDINKVQRRSFVRIPCLLEASCCFLEIYSETLKTESEPDDPKEWFPILINNISLGGIAATVKLGFQGNFYKKGRYLLAADFGKGLMFLNLLLRNIFSNNDMLNGTFAFGGLSVYQDRTIGNFVRRQELLGRQR